MLYLLFHNTSAVFNLKLPVTTQAKPSVLMAFSSRPCVLVVRCGHYKPFALFARWHLAIAITSYKSYPTDKFFHLLLYYIYECKHVGCDCAAYYFAVDEMCVTKFQIFNSRQLRVMVEAKKSFKMLDISAYNFLTYHC